VAGCRTVTGCLSAGPIIGGLLIAGLGWRAIFFINLPIGAGGLWLTHRCAPEATPAMRRFDVGGQMTAVIALGGLAWALIEGGDAGSSSLAVVAAFVLAAASLAGFRLIEVNRSEPMLPLGLFGPPGLRQVPQASACVPTASASRTAR
jgi:MFS transporter, DHA2 family, methylenomycin A resistance protein